MSPTIQKLRDIFFQIYPEKLRKKGIASYGLGSYSQLYKEGVNLNELNSQFEREYFNKNPKICKYCQKLIPLANHRISDYRKKQFCNQSCSASYHNTGKVKNIYGALGKNRTTESIGRKSFDPVTNERIPLQEAPCEWCGTMHKKEIFCSQECYFANQYCENFLDWYLKRKPMIKNSQIRKYLTDIYGYQCDNHRKGKECFCDPNRFHELTLEVDHIDGHHENNAPSNVRLLCPTCHMATDTYGGANRGNGREYRRVRYAEGKSF